MRKKSLTLFVCLFIALVQRQDLRAQAASYPDQHFVLSGADSLLANAQSLINLIRSSDGKSLTMADGATDAMIILKPQNSPHPWNLGLPSWNGTAPGDSGGFRVSVRIPYLSGWSTWLDGGYWKDDFWPTVKRTAFGGGMVDIDFIKLDAFTATWQYAVQFKRKSASVASPTLSRLSFFASDSRTTETVDHTALLADKPAAIFIATTFLAQRNVSAEFGGRICSPTTVAMILKSYHIQVDPLQFALDTYDPYYDIFGGWPRVVQNASEYGVIGDVVRIRSWSQARDVLARGGRLAMSIGEPLYGGHLVMLAGFTANGDPIVHDPARANDGYGHVFNKSDLSQAWFDKGGVAYCFFQNHCSATLAAGLQHADQPSDLRLLQNYPNPFNAVTHFIYETAKAGFVEFTISDVTGRRVTTLLSGRQPAGTHQIRWEARDAAGFTVAGGMYFYQLRFEDKEVKTGRLLLIK
ncbi:MAG TPA: C39 family peptidase [bacterium]|nr:C39 family peptidase [bacterium]